MTVVKRLDQGVSAILTVFSTLALPVIMLLFLQWPLRDVFQMGSREANDLGQWLFALYVASSMTMATRKDTHLKSEVLSRHFTPENQWRLKQAGLLFGLLPWACFILWAAWPLVVQSVLQWERFSDTGNPGYVFIKLALVVMAGLIVVQALLDLFTPRPQEKAPH
jgi:TRAP-type mannitol/chloroaromatic compound transport system permease small subunit